MALFCFRRVLDDDGLGWVWSPTRIITMSRCTAYIRLQSCVQRLSHVPCTLATRIIISFFSHFRCTVHPTGWIVDVVHPFLRTPDVATLCRRSSTEKWSATLCRGGFPFQSTQYFFPFSLSDRNPGCSRCDCHRTVSKECDASHCVAFPSAWCVLSPLKPISAVTCRFVSVLSPSFFTCSFSRFWVCKLE